MVVPGLLSANTQRGGGIEEQLYRTGLELSKNFNSTIVSPFYINYLKRIKVNDNMTIEEVYFPSCKNYPPKTFAEHYMSLFSMVLYSFLVLKKIIDLKKRGLRLVVLTDSLVGIAPAITAKLLKTNVIFSEGNLWPWVNPYIFHKALSVDQKVMRGVKISFGRLLGRLSSCIRVQSAAIKEGMISNGLNPKKIFIIGPGLDTKSFRSDRTDILPHEKFRVGFVGRLVDEKGAPLLLEVCKKAQEEIPSVSFVICGGGAYEEKFRLLRNVEHLGYVTRDNLPTLLSRVQAVLFFQNEIGIAELEAMALEKVVIVCKTKSIRQVIKHFENGILCAPEAKSYIEAIKVLIQNQTLIFALSKSARETVEELFGWNIIGREWSFLCKICINDLR
jgi:glycosyltransferase involved in cell wall biosynthesis